jgi:aryl-phospho-beta-D-glucosidase BglC (GH1 family)
MKEIDMPKSILFALATIVFVTSACAGTGTTDQSRSDFVRTQDGRLVAGDGKDEVRLRGIAIYKSNRPPSTEDYEELAGLHVNTVRLAFSYRHFYDKGTPHKYRQSAWDWIDAHVALAREHEMWLILQNCGVEGAQFVPVKGVPFDYSIWDDTDLQDRFISLWRAIAERYRDEPQIVGYSLFCEPVAAESKAQWQDLAQRTIDEIRQTDRNHVVFVERIYGENKVRREVSGVDLAPDDAFFAVDDDNVVYEFYYFERDEYTHQFAPWRVDVQEARVYPDEDWIIHYRETSGLERDLPFTRDYLGFYLRRQLEFGETQNAPMAVWGFGALKTCYKDGRGGLRWLRDVVDQFNETRVHWTLWGYYDEEFGVRRNEGAKGVLRDALAGSD